MAKKTKVIIVGGGIAGLAMGRALDIIGMDYIILERSPVISEVGTGIAIWSNGAFCLKRLGLEDQFERKSLHYDKSCFLNHKGKTLLNMDLSDCKKKFGASSSRIHRAELIDILLCSVKSENVLLNSEVQSFLESDTGVTVQLVSGKKIEGDILIGADGIHSVIRKHLRDDRQPKYAGYTCWRGLIAIDRVSPLFRSKGVLGMGPGCLFGFDRLRGRKAYWFAATLVRPDSSKECKLEMLKKKFFEWPKSIRDIIDYTPENYIIRHDILYLDPKKNWGKGKCTLIGDSAHGATHDLAQGACMALEDAVELAYLFSMYSNKEQALRVFEKKRYARTADMIKKSRLVGKASILSHPFPVAIRNLVFSVIGGEGLKWMMKKYIDYHVPDLKCKTGAIE